MEYPFKDLLPLDEVTARTGYYKDWTHIDAGTFHQISELVNFIREKGYGADTREAIAQALERVYHDAIKSDNANMEVSMARKHFKDLAARLDAGDEHVDDIIVNMTQQISNLIDGTPRISAETLSELQTRYPEGAQGVALVRETDPVKMYLWNGTSWVDYGAYQGRKIDDDSIGSSKIMPKSILDKHQSNSFVIDESVSFKKVATIESNRIYVPYTQKLWGEGTVSVEFNSAKVESGRIYHLKKTTGSNFVVLNAIDFTSKIGTNYIETGIAIDDDSDEYIGMINGGVTFGNDYGVVGHYATGASPSNNTLDIGETIYLSDSSTGIIKLDVKIYVTPIKDYSKKYIEQAIRTSKTTYDNLFDSSYLKEKNIENYELIADGKLYLTEDEKITEPGLIGVSFNGGLSGSGYVGVVRKHSNTKFEVVYLDNITANEGINDFNTKYNAVGDGTEYVFTYGFRTKYKGTPSGVHIPQHTLTNPTMEEGSMLQTSYNATGQVDFAIKIKVYDTQYIKNIAGASTSKSKIYTLNDAWVAWLNGEKFPIAFYSDSTTDGMATTGHTNNILGTDHQPPNAYTTVLQSYLRQATNNNILRIYNAGFSGEIMPFAKANLLNEFGSQSAYSDTKMAFVGFGINDRLQQNSEKDYREVFKSDLVEVVKIFVGMGIQPVMMTTQAILSPDVSTAHSDRYPMRDAMHINTVANQVKKEVAEEYNLDFIDVNYFTQKFMQYSKVPLNQIIPDKLHFGDAGHEYEAGLFFKELNPQTITIDKPTQIDYTNQRLAVGVPEDKVTMLSTVSDSFKAVANYTKNDTSDTIIFKAYVFNDGDSQSVLRAFKGREDSSTYVKVNGITHTLSGLESQLPELELGLHTLEVWTGSSAIVDFKGFKLG